MPTARRMFNFGEVLVTVPAWMDVLIRHKRMMGELRDRGSCHTASTYLYASMWRVAGISAYQPRVSNALVCTARNAFDAALAKPQPALDRLLDVR